MPDKLDNCIFCQVISGKLPSSMVHENEHFVAFRDIAPKADTHVLIVPRAHHADLDAWVDLGSSSDELMAFVVDTAWQLSVSGHYRLITNVGPAAGQDVFHFHFHLLAGDELPGF